MNLIYALTVQYPWIYFSCKQKGSGFEACWNGAKHTLHKYGEFDETVAQRLAAWYFISITVSYVSLLLNTCIIYELRLVIENPFQTSEKRNNFYVAGSVGISIILSWIGLSFTTSYNAILAEWNLRMYQLIALGNCIFACYRMIWVTIRLKKPGVSGKIRRELRARYVEYMVIYAIFSWPICYITKPSYRYIPSLNAFIGGTEFISNG